MRQLDDASHRKLESLSRWDRDCGDAVRWLRQNQNKFKMEIFEPPMLSCTVPDNRFVHAVEACFGSAQLKVHFARVHGVFVLIRARAVDLRCAV